MPISAIDGAGAEHWAEVKAVITEAVEAIPEVRFTVRLVSDADDVGVIQKRIVQNVYSSDIVVCDVSGKNPNVMFELGMRLAFDKATVIVKDDKTDYSFDTAIIEHVGYPRDLRFGKIVAFKELLAAKVLQTYRSMRDNTDKLCLPEEFWQVPGCVTFGTRGAGAGINTSDASRDSKRYCDFEGTSRTAEHCATSSW